MKTTSPAETVPLAGAPASLAAQLVRAPWNRYWKFWALLFSPGVKPALPSNWHPPTDAADAAGAIQSNDATTPRKARNISLRNMQSPYRCMTL